MTQPWTRHGGALEQARDAFGGVDWIDLSTGINPDPWPHAQTIAIDWARLPGENALTELEAAAAAHFGVDPTFVCALPGTEIGLRLIGDLLPGPARYGWPAYRTHAEMFAQSTAASPDASSDDVLILANPNNPDGLVVTREAVTARSGWTVIDEAFADADPSISLARHVADGARLAIFRSFGKFFGLAGVRLGFVVAPPALIAAYRAKIGAWPVSAAALAIGTAAYRDRGWVASTRDGLKSRAAALDAVLMRAGFVAHGTCPLFRLIEVEDAAALFERLARAAILTRPFDYNPRWLRIGLPRDAEASARLEDALVHG